MMCKMPSRVGIFLGGVGIGLSPVSLNIVRNMIFRAQIANMSALQNNRHVPADTRSRLKEKMKAIAPCSLEH